MQLMKDLLNQKRQIEKIYVVIVALCVVILAALAFLVIKIKTDKEQDTITYDYTEIEQKIADEVKEYLSSMISLSEKTEAQIADAAVENYNIIIGSNVDIVNDDHTDAIKRRMRAAMVALIEDAARLTDNDLDGLSSGVAAIIWNAILGQINEVTATSDYEQEYIYLAKSIQDQINELEERKMKVSIQANIKNEASADIDAESLLSALNGLNDEELRALADALGISLEELYKLINSNNSELRKTIKEEILKEIQTKYGNVTNGKDGTNGQNGQNGQDGKNGTDGKAGKTTYIAYADDMFGAGFSLTPTETSKYVGTCITAESSQPVDYASYSNWQIYRTYIITTTVDENNVTTVHIN